MSGTEYKQPLLSICIPTYNRADILNETLLDLTSNPDFGEEIEIVISDNCSTDHTAHVVREFLNQFYNIKYYKNSTNIKDANFFKVLSLGNGRYLKLMNDTVKFKDGMLKFMLDQIKANVNTHNNLLFYQNNYFNSNKLLSCTDINAFVEGVSFLCTWIANFGIWKDRLLHIKDANKNVSLMLVQVEWSLQLSCWSNTWIYFNDYYKVTSPSKKGGYNIFKVFIDNYLHLLNHYLTTQQLKYEVFNSEKYRLFMYFVLPWLYNLLFKNNQYFFDTTKAFSIIYKHYKWCPYFYFGPFILFLKKTKTLFKQKI